MHRCLFTIAITVLLVTGIAPPAEAGRRSGDGDGTGFGLYTTGQELLYVAETNMPDGAGGTLSLCHLVDRASFFGVLPIYTTLEGYAVAENGCDATAYNPVSDLSLIAYQNSGAIPREIPSEPSLSVLQIAWGHAFLLGFGLILLAKAARGAFGRDGQRRRSAGALPMKNADAVAVHSIIAMSNVAQADGHLDPSELHEMARILSRIKGQDFPSDRVAAIVEQTNPTMEEFAQVGQGLHPKDRRVVMQAALTIAVADGRIDPREYDLVANLATQMGISGDDFRAALRRVSDVMDGPIPA